MTSETRPSWNGLRLLAFCLVIPFLFSCGQPQPPTGADGLLSEAAFLHPPLQARPSCLWVFLNGNVDKAQITRELEEMKANGMRGAIFWDVGSLVNPDGFVPAGPAFFGPESLDAMHHAMNEAERLGLEMGLFTSSSWNAGGAWITPDIASKKLLWSELELEGPRTFSGPLPLPDKVSEHRFDIAVLAVPAGGGKQALRAAAIRLDAQLDENGVLTWQVPEGKWTVLRFVCTNTGEFLNCPSPNSRGLVIDHLSAPAIEAHFNHMLDALATRPGGLGPLKVFMLDSYEVRPAFDWTPDMVRAFTAEFGYDPTPWLPALAGWTVDSEELSERFRHDYHKMVSEQLVRNHFARAREVANARGVHLLAEAGHGGHARVDPLKALGSSDIPMGEFWNHRKNWVTKEAASAANLYNKKLVNAESFTGWQHWQDGPAAYKRLLDIALCAGLNQVSFHTFAHNPPAAGKPGYAYHAGEHFNANNTWWHVAGPMIEDMSRACHLMQQGRFVADVLAYYGDNAPNLVPARRIAPTVEPLWSDDHCLHCGKPLPVDLRSLAHGYDYDYVNEEIILTALSLQDGRLVLPHGMSYRVLVLPERETISPAALERIADLVAQGATIVGPRPQRSNSLKNWPACDEQVRTLAEKVWGDVDGTSVKSRPFGKGRVFWNVPLTEVMETIGVPRDFVALNIGNADRHIDYIHRATEKQDIYLVSNSSLERKALKCRFRVQEGRVPGFWNAEDGRVSPCFHYEHRDGFAHLDIELAPASSIFVVFTEQQAPEHLVELARVEDGTSWTAAYPEIEVAGVEGQATARVWRPGTYRFTTSKGRSGRWVVGEVPAPQAIPGPWTLRFPDGLGAPPQVELAQLIDWTLHPDPGVRYFSGTATYQSTFTAPPDHPPGSAPLMLDLGKVREVARVRVNGREAGILWKEPYRIDISTQVRPGVNQLEIEVTNVWNNRLVGDQNSPPENRVARTNLTPKFNPQSPLLPSGLIGPVSLRAPALSVETR